MKTLSLTKTNFKAMKTKSLTKKTVTFFALALLSIKKTYAQAGDQVGRKFKTMGDEVSKAMDYLLGAGMVFLIGYACYLIIFTDEAQKAKKMFINAAIVGGIWAAKEAVKSIFFN